MRLDVVIQLKLVRCRTQLNRCDLVLALPEPGGGTLTLQGHARVNGNTASDGGGIYNDLGDGGVLIGATAGVNVKFNLPNNIVSS